MSTPAQFYHSLPPVIRAYGTSCLLTTIAVSLRLLNPYFIFFSRDKVFKELQIWRVITNFFFLGSFSPSFAFHLLMLARYGVQLERVYSERNKAQFLWMIIVGMLTLLGAGTILNTDSLAFMGPPIVFKLLYLWSREFPNVGVSLLGLVTIQGFYLPWAMLFINAIFGHSIFQDFAGIVVGHLYYFFTVLHPRAGGKEYLRAPEFFLKLLQKWGFIDRIPRQPDRPQAPQQRTSAPPSASEGTAFRGRSYRLDRD